VAGPPTVTAVLGTAALRRGIATLDAGRPIRALVDTAGTALCLATSLLGAPSFAVGSKVRT